MEEITNTLLWFDPKIALKLIDYLHTITGVNKNSLCNGKRDFNITYQDLVNDSELLQKNASDIYTKCIRYAYFNIFRNIEPIFGVMDSLYNNYSMFIKVYGIRNQDGNIYLTAQGFSAIPIYKLLEKYPIFKNYLEDMNPFAPNYNSFYKLKITTKEEMDQFKVLCKLYIKKLV